MMAANEDHLLREFQASGSREALRSLLVAHQDRVYNVCYQVLGRREDAEDAAQEGLLRLAGGARSASDADAFRGWIYRVSLRVALDLWRRREAARRLESRAAMNRTDTRPFDDKERRALFEAMERLGDGDRAVLMEHYFEKVPLEELGARRGITAVAIWKRIDRARETLKRALLGAGFVSVEDRVGHALESVVPATAPAALLGEAFLAKALVGGLTVGMTKGPVISAAVIAVILAFVLGTGGYQLLRSREPARRFTSKPQVGRSAPDPTPGPAASPAVPGAEIAKGTPPNPRNELRERLERYKLWHVEWKALGRSISAVADNAERVRLIVEKSDEARKLLEGARELIFDDSKTFMDFLRDPANEELCEMVIGHALDKCQSIEGVTIVQRQKFADFPQSLMDGFLDLLRIGTPGQKAPLLRFLIQLDGVSEEFDLQYAALLNDFNPGVRAGAIAALTRYRALPAAVLEQVKQVYEGSSDPGVRSAALDAIGRTDTEEVQRWMVSRLEVDRDPDMVRYVAKASMMSLMSNGGSADDKTVDRHASALMAAAKVRTHDLGYQDLVLAAVHLPANRCVPVLEEALSNAPSHKLAGAVSKLLEKIRAGGTNWKSLMMEFQSLVSKN